MNNNELDIWVKLDGIDIDGTLKEVESILAHEKGLSPALKSVISVLVLVVKLLTNRVGLNSKNSSTKSRLHEENHHQVIQTGKKQTRRNQVKKRVAKKATLERHLNKSKSLMKLKK